MPVRSEAPAKRSQDFKADYELLNEKLMDLLSAAKYDELEWKEVNGMQVLADNYGPATFKVPGRDAVAFVMLLDPSQSASNSTCSAGNIMASQQFWNSAHNDNDASLNYWHDNYPNLNTNYIPPADDDDGNDSSLCCAAKNNNTEMVQEIAAWGGSPVLSCRHGYTALCYAAENGNPEMVQFLIKDGSSINAICDDLVGNEDTNALCLASQANSPLSEEALLRANSTVNTTCGLATALCWVTAYNQTLTGLQYIDAGADVDGDCAYGYQSIVGTPLCYSSYNDNMNITQSLLEHGANSNLKCTQYKGLSTYYYYPICYAQWNGNDAMVALFMDYGSQPCND